MSQAAPEPSKTAPREYIILQKSSGDYWQKVGTVMAPTMPHAIKKHIAAVELASKTDQEDADSFVAIPIKYWKPKTPAIEVKTTVTLS